MRLAFGQIEIALPDAIVEFQRLVLHAVEQLATAGAFQADARVKVDNQRELRHVRADREIVDGRHG